MSINISISISISAGMQPYIMDDIMGQPRIWTWPECRLAVQPWPGSIGLKPPVSCIPALD
jgi:hypothetical protein